MIGVEDGFPTRLLESACAAVSSFALPIRHNRLRRLTPKCFVVARPARSGEETKFPDMCRCEGEGVSHEKNRLLRDGFENAHAISELVGEGSGRG